jgi:branched-chain amino acid transport system ATP-binding protein
MSSIEARGLDAGWNGVPVVRSLDLVVNAGEIVALLGPNGAGKTTTVSALAGIISPLGGSVFIDGKEARSGLRQRSRNGLGLVTEERAVFMRLTVRDNLRLGAGSEDAAIEFFPELRPLLGRRVGLLSGGEQQMLALGRCLASEPRFILVDELSLGLAPLIVERLLGVLKDAAARGIGVLVVEQRTSLALDLADRAYLMQRGLVVLSGTSGELLADFDAVRQSYL